MHFRLTRQGSIFLDWGLIRIELSGAMTHAYPFGRTIFKIGKWKICDIYPLCLYDDIDPDDIPF